MNASSETTQSSSEKHPLRWSTFITPRGGDNRPPFQNYGSLQNTRIARKIDPRLYNPLSRVTKRETGELHGKSKPRRKAPSDRAQNWQELQKRKFTSGKPLEPPVDATSFMRKRPDKNKRLVRYLGHHPGKHISKPRQVNPSDPESAYTSGNTTRSSVTLPDGLDANEDDVEAPSYLDLPRGSSEPHDERRQVLDKSNIKINNIREILKDDMSDNKQLTINLVVRPGSNKTTNHPPEAIVLPPIPATAANNYTPFNSTSQAPSQPYPRNTNEVSVTQHVPITQPPLSEGGNDPRNGRSFKGMGDPGNKYQPRTHSPYINGVPKYQDQSMNWHSGQIPANGHGLPNERRVLTPSHRNYDPDLDTSRRQIPESYRTTGGPFRQPTYFRAESPRTRSELPYLDERRNMLSPSYSEPHPGRGFDPRRAPTPDDLRKLSAKRFLKANDRQRRDHASREKSVWEAQQGETRYVAMTPPPHRHKQPNLPYQRLHDKENKKPQKTVSTLTGEVQYLVKNPQKSYKSRPSSRAHSLSSKGSVTMVTDQPKVTRVKDSVAQTDLDYDEDIDVDDQIKSNTTPSSRAKEIAIQTNPRDAPPQSKEVGSQWVYDDFERSKEISVQVDNDDLVFNKEISTQVENDDIVQNKEISTQTRDDDLPRQPVTMATQTYMDFEDAHTPPPQLRHKMYKSNDMYSKINEIIKEEGEASTADNDSRKDSGFRGSSTQKEADNINHDDDDDEAVFSFDAISGYSHYYMYMRTDDGGVIGPLKFECKETHLGLPVRSKSDATHDGLRNRATGSNSVNEHSSRSHSMLTLNIESDMVDPDDDNLYVTKHGKLTFVDLAGSEKTKTGSEMASDPGHLAETNNINRSLLVLGNCISALGDPKKRQGHIPYRDSKLTKLLADSLGGQGVTLMIACVAPSAINSAESMNTLRYANRAKKIKSKPVVKMDPREKLIISLKREIKVLRQENHYLRQQLDFPVKPRGQLQKENDAKFLQMLKEQKRDGKVSDHGLYEMLQEYMIENETLRHENSDLLQSKDGGRREQQLLARENERLLKKMDHYEKERVMLQSPVSVYSTGSTLSRKSTGLYSQYEGQPYTNGHQDNRKDAPWGPQRQPQIAESPRGKKTSPPSHLQHPMKPPHRLNEPVNKNNPAYIDNNSYSSQYQQHKHSPDAAPRGPPRGRERNIPQHSDNDDYAAYHQQHSQPRGSDHSPSRIPRPRKEDPSPQISRTNDYSPNRQPSNRSKDKPGAVPNMAFGRPAGKNTGKSPPVQRKFNKGGPSQQPALLTINSDEENLQVTETDKALQDRLRQDLVDLQGQIRNQAQQLERTPGDQGNTKQGRR